MSFDEVRSALVERLEEGDRGDRGWFIITRVHVALSWLKGIAEYIEARGAGASVALTARDYHQLSVIIQTDTEDPGVQLRRHHLLVMDKPLQLLRRTRGQSWQDIELTQRGRALALSDDPAEILEAALSDIRFAAEPWCSDDRSARYAEFDVHVYEATKRVLAQCDGYIDRDEFDFFLSRIRKLDEVDWAAHLIASYRALSRREQSALHAEVRGRIPGAKAYANWRDIGLHTFSLFSLGTAMVRDGTTLRLTGNWANTQEAPPAEAGTPTPPQLKMPEPAESESLLAPPAAPATNDGADAESFVAKVFRSQGWTVAFYTNRRGFGFDLWARKDEAAVVIEVKSSLGALGAVNLTENEYRAAREHRENYVLALVENLDSDKPRLRLIENPIDRLEITERAATSYSVSRAVWLRAAGG